MNYRRRWSLYASWLTHLSKCCAVLCIEKGIGVPVWSMCQSVISVTSAAVCSAQDHISSSGKIVRTHDGSLGVRRPVVVYRAGDNKECTNGSLDEWLMDGRTDRRSAPTTDCSRHHRRRSPPWRAHTAAGRLPLPLPPCSSGRRRPRHLSPVHAADAASPRRLDGGDVVGAASINQPLKPPTCSGSSRRGLLFLPSLDARCRPPWEGEEIARWIDVKGSLAHCGVRAREMESQPRLAHRQRMTLHGEYCFSGPPPQPGRLQCRIACA